MENNQKPAEEHTIQVIFRPQKIMQPEIHSGDMKMKDESETVQATGSKSGLVGILKSFGWWIVLIFAVIFMVNFFQPYFEECVRIGTWNC